MDEEYDFNERNERVADMIEQAGDGNVSGLVQSVRDSTMMNISDAMIWAFIVVLFLRALSEFIRRTGEATRPIVEVAAEKWRESDDDYSPTVKTKR